MQGVFLDFPCGFSSLAGSQMGFSAGGIGFSARRLVSRFDSLTTELLKIST